MISDEVTGLCRPLHQFRLCFGAPTENKECCPDVVVGKNVEQLRRPRRIGSVVEGEC